MQILLVALLITLVTITIAEPEPQFEYAGGLDPQLGKEFILKKNIKCLNILDTQLKIVMR